MRQLLICMSALLVTSGCSTIFPGHPNSEVKKSEKVELTIDDCEADLFTADVGSAASALVPVVAGFLFDRAVDALESEADRYSASYSAATSGVFYQAAPKEANGSYSAVVGLCGFSLERTVGESDEVAAKLDFGVGVGGSQGDAFQISLKRVAIQKAKAKVLDASWSNKWFARVFLYGLVYDLARLVGVRDYGDAAIDLSIEVEVEALWIDGKQKSHRETIAKLKRTISDINIDDPKEGESNVLTPGYNWGWMPAPPVSYFGNKPWGKGNYTITVKVTEADDFGDLVKKAAEKLAENRERVVERVTEVVKSDGETSD